MQKVVYRWLAVGKTSMRSFRSNNLVQNKRFISETATTKAAKEMRSAFQELNQADQLLKKHVYGESLVLLNRVNDIVKSFSAPNSPMLQVINRKKLELFYLQKNKADIVKTIKEMKANVDSRNDKDEAFLERIMYLNVLLNMGSVEECSEICRELEAMPVEADKVVHKKLIISLYKHLAGQANEAASLNRILQTPELSVINKAILMNNQIGMLLDDDGDKEIASNLCKQCAYLIETMADEEATLSTRRQILNNCGNYLLSIGKIEEGGKTLKDSLRLSDSHSIRISENVISSVTLSAIASILLKQDQPVTCEGLYLQALEVFTQREKAKTLGAFSRSDLYDYAKVCDGYGELLVHWDKREPLGEQYKQKSVDLLMKVNEGADWVFPLTSHFIVPELFRWELFYVCWKCLIELHCTLYI